MRRRRRQRARAAPDQWTTGHLAPRVLVEEPDGASIWAMTRILESAGYEVRSCAGPTEEPCPLLDGRPCELVSGADVIWNHLGLRDSAPDLLHHHLARRPSTPVVVELPEPSRADAGPILDDPAVTFVAFPVLAPQVLATLAALTGPAPEWSTGTGAPRRVLS